MNLRLLTTRPIQDLRQLVRQNHPLGRSYGHAHFWERAAHSRRSFLQAGLTLAAGLAITPVL
jgi:hypothetical protein